MSSSRTPSAPLSTSQTSRRGSTLVVSMIVISAVVAMLALSSEQMLGMHALSGINLINQSNSNAAEAGASMIEGCLKTYAANNAALTVDIAPTQAVATAAQVTVVPAVWMNYMGYTGPYQAWLGASNQTAWPNLWVGNSMLQWRIEPVSIVENTFSGTAPNAATTTYNYDPTNPVTGSTTTASGGSVLSNPGFFHYRIIVTSWYVDPVALALSGQTMATATPWSPPTLPAGSPPFVRSTMQVQRQVELKMLNLFQYVIFYGATGPAGDIEFHPGSSLAITGAVHSNNAIYFGGTTLAGTNYHSATDQGGQITIGTSSAYVGIDAPYGLFRQQKDVNSLFAINTGITGVLNPANVPARNQSIGGVAMSGNNDLNGDTDSSSIIQLNGYNFVSTMDTRVGLATHGIATESPYIRDGSNGSAVVQTLANFPQLAGYPFEYQQIVPSATNGQTTPLCIKGACPASASIQWNPNEFTIASTLYPNAQRLYYSNAPASALTVTTTTTSYPVYASDLPLWNFNNPITGNSTYQDIWPSMRWYPGYCLGILNGSSLGPTTSGSPLPTKPYWPTVSINSPDPTNGGATNNKLLDTYLPLSSAIPTDGFAVEGYFLAEALHGIRGAATTGLVIRERGAPNLNFTWDRVSTSPSNPLVPNQGTLVIADPQATPAGMGGAPFWCMPSPLPTTSQEWVNAYAAMMCSKYVVTMGMITNSTLLADAAVNKIPLDITYKFFHYGLGSGYGTHVPNPFGPVAPYFVTSAIENAGYNGPVQNPVISTFVGASVSSALGMICTSDLFINNREGSWLQVNNYISGTQAAAYKVDALTLNIGQICSFLANTTWLQVDPTGLTSNAPTALLSAGFNGILYTNRTPHTFAPLNEPGLPYCAFPASTVGSFGQPYGSAGSTYPTLMGYTTQFLQRPTVNVYGPSYYDFTGTHPLPIYDPIEPWGYGPLEDTLCFSGSNNSMFHCAADMVSTLGIGNNYKNMYPVIGTTTTTNGGTVGVGTGSTYAYVGQPNVWSVYPTALAVRVFNASHVNWGGVQLAAGNRPQGLTVITPNTGYLWGDYNTQTYPDSSGNQQVTPCAIFCDGLTTLSNGWVDDNPGNAIQTHIYTNSTTNATSTSYIISVVINNQPTDLENTQEEGSDGTHNVIRYAENWGGCTWTFQGSLVVLNRMRYTRSYVPGAPSGTSPFSIPPAVQSYAGNTGGSFYGVPSRVYKFNSDLLTSAGQPPASLSGVQTQRVISTVNLVNK